MDILHLFYLYIRTIFLGPRTVVAYFFLSSVFHHYQYMIRSLTLFA